MNTHQSSLGSHKKQYFFHIQENYMSNKSQKVSNESAGSALPARVPKSSLKVDTAPLPPRSTAPGSITNQASPRSSVPSTRDQKSSPRSSKSHSDSARPQAGSSKHHPGSGTVSPSITLASSRDASHPKTPTSDTHQIMVCLYIQYERVISFVYVFYRQLTRMSRIGLRI